jgi:restriction system protein
MNEIRRVADKQYREKRKRKLQGQTTKSECRIEVADDSRLRLLNRMRHLAAADFIKICQEILIKSGFNKLRIAGRNDDESFDGECIFQENPLNRSCVLFRMKCDERLVETEDIKSFRKAMTYCADKGIFMTMGFFSSDAKYEAQREGVSAIALMDKKKLVGMIERLRIQLKDQ